MGEEYYNLRTPWREMSYCKYPPLSQHERLILEYDIDRENFELEHEDDYLQIEYIWGEW